MSCGEEVVGFGAGDCVREDEVAFFVVGLALCLSKASGKVLAAEAEDTEIV